MCDCGGNYGCTFWCEDERQARFEAKYGKKIIISSSNVEEINSLKDEIESPKKEVRELREIIK